MEETLIMVTNEAQRDDDTLRSATNCISVDHAMDIGQETRSVRGLKNSMVVAMEQDGFS